MTFTELDCVEEWNVLVRELIFCIVISVAATCIWMYFHNEAVIVTEHYYFAHRHSWVCYLGWSVFNMTVFTVPYFIIMGAFTHFPVFTNLGIFLYNRMVSFRKKKPTVKKDKNDTLAKFNQLLEQK